MHGISELTIKQMDQRGSGLIPISKYMPWQQHEDIYSYYMGIKWNIGSVTEVDIESLFTVQVNLETKKLLWRLNNQPGEPANIVKTMAGYCIIDGHHRLAIAWLCGIPRFPAYVIDSI